MVGQLIGLQCSQRNLLTRGHVYAIELQYTIDRQAGDLDGLQRLAFRVGEPGLEQLIGQYDGRVFLPHHTDIGHLWRGVVEALHTDLVGVVAAVAHTVTVAIPGGPVAAVGHGKAAVGQAGDRGLELGRVGVGVDQRLAIDALA